ncbi:MAG: ankyrin repeat domain-containing protein [Candidatus Berkelbacteria bacterium]|nr:ankyrin repeat domain-containing protein [Candidatus Berkelbacteria bacterium]
MVATMQRKASDRLTCQSTHFRPSCANGKTCGKSYCLYSTLISNDDSDGVRSFLSSSKTQACLQYRGEYGRTGLHLAAFTGSLNAARALLESGMDVNIGDDYGNTPLLLAIFEYNLKMADLLLSFGADINRPTKAGKTPLHFIALRNDFDGFEFVSGWAQSKGYLEVNSFDLGHVAPVDNAIVMHNYELAAQFINHGAKLGYLSRAAQMQKVFGEERDDLFDLAWQHTPLKTFLEERKLEDFSLFATLDSIGISNLVEEAVAWVRYARQLCPQDNDFVGQVKKIFFCLIEEACIEREQAV